HARPPHRPAPGIRIRIAIGDEREGSAAESLDFERRLAPGAPAHEKLGRLPGKDDVAGPAAVAATAAPVDAANELRVEADAGGERASSPVRPAERDPARRRR